MNKPTRTFAGVLVSAIIAITPSHGFALESENYNLCRDSGVVFAFFNGVQTTPLAASRAMNEFKRIHGDDNGRGENIRYETLYNHSNGFEDFIETFEQRVLEQDQILSGRYELAFEIVNGGGSWWQRLSQLTPTLNQLRDDFLDWYRAAAISSLASLAGSAPTSVNYADHRSRLDTWILEGKQILMVAHSQGNLFANAAYNYASNQTDTGALKLVHIAPASPTTNGVHRLADKDLVINGLRAVGSVVDITDVIPGYLLRPAGLNGQKDLLGHGLLEIYLNPELNIGGAVVSDIEAGIASLRPPQILPQAETGFFTATMTWNGAGDVDLHMFEPSGTHVYYPSKRGQSGYLDVDNTRANGPEHYFATCDAQTLQTGVYQVRLANYSRADGRIATVQIASIKDGSLGTRSVTLGERTGNDANFMMFDVTVSKDDTTGKYEVSID